MSFGFSIGDVLVCSQVAYRTYTALKSAPAEFQELRLEVLSLNTTLQALADESSSPTSIILLAPPQRQESLRILLENCTKGLKQLDLLVGKYPSLGPNEKTRFLEHIRFASKGKQGPRDKLAIHTASINIFLTSLTHSSLGRLELLIKNALRGGGETDTFSALGAIKQESDAWNSIGRDLALEGITSNVAVKFKHEIEAYTRHLANGGDPFWMKSRPDAPQSQGTPQPATVPQYQGTPQPSSAPQYQSPPQPQGAPPKYEAQPPMRPPISAPAVPQQRPSGLFGSTPQPQGYSFGQAAPAQYAPYSASPVSQGPPGNPQQQPPDAGFGSPAPPQQHSQSTTGANFGKPGSYSGKPLFGSNTPAGPGQSAGNGQDQTSSGSNQTQQGFGRFGQPSSNATPVTGGLFGSGSQQQPFSFGAHNPEEKPEEYFGSAGPTAPTTGGGLFGQPAQQQTTGGLFGSKPAAGTSNTTGSLFSGGQSQHTQTSSGFGATAPGSDATGGQQTPGTGSNLFGSQPAAPSGALFGGSLSSRPALGNSTAYSSDGNAGSLFGAPQVGTKQVDELSELFDHIFDIDEDVAAVAQGARSVPYPLDRPTPVNESRYVPPVYSPPVYVPSPAPLHQSVIEAQNIHQRPPQDKRLLNNNQTNPSIITNKETTINNNLLHTVRLQLEQVIIQYRDAQRAGNSRLVDHLLQNSIQERVSYLRNAGAILIQCDLCHIPITDGYYHCDICANGDWDCCPQCLEQGRGCLGGHGLGRRNKDWVGEKHWMRC